MTHWVPVISFRFVRDTRGRLISPDGISGQPGKGSIQGFAVTLLIGNAATLFAAVFVSRLIFDFELDMLRAKRILLTWRKIA